MPYSDLLQLTLPYHFLQNCASSRPSSSVTSSRPVSFPLGTTPSQEEDATPTNPPGLAKEEEKTRGESDQYLTNQVLGLILATLSDIIINVPVLFLLWQVNMFAEKKINSNTQRCHCHLKLWQGKAWNNNMLRIVLSIIRSTSICWSQIHLMSASL